MPSDRIFSSAGTIISEKRSKLSDENASMYVFLHENLKKSRNPQRISEAMQ